MFRWWKQADQFMWVPQQEEELPVVWNERFPGYDALEVEIGFGNGEFLVHSAGKQPKNLYLGFELSLESCEKAIKKAITAGVKNVRIIRGDAGILMRELFQENSISHVYMNFPDPWPKKRHEEKRLIKDAFIKTLANVLSQGGLYELATDQEFYAESAKELFLKSPYFEIETYEKNPIRPVQTKYEKKWLALGRDIYQLKVRKIKSTRIKRMFEGGPMPHVKIRENIQPEAIVPSLVGKEFKTENAFFKILNVYSNENGLLLRVVANDDGFVQNYFVKIVHRTDEWLVKLDEITQPFRTPSVKFSVFEIGRKLTHGMSNES